MNSKEVGASQAPNIFYLDKIISLKRQLQVFDILMHFHPTHEERLWLVGFLKYAGYKYKEVLDIIDNHCQWSDYKPDVTSYQVSTVFKQAYRKLTVSSSHVRRKRKWDLSELEVWRINLARTSEINRRLTEQLEEKGIPIYESPHCRELPFKPETLLRGGV